MAKRKCSVDGCERLLRYPARGFCAMHYQRWRAANPKATRGRWAGYAKPLCRHSSCERPAHAHGLCQKHLDRQAKYGTTTAQSRPTFAERFWAKVDKDGPIPAFRPDLGPCWMWTGSKQQSGHGSIYRDGSVVRVHRVTYEWFTGPIADDREIDHLCRVRACCNPEHLEAVTRKENVRRGLQGDLKTHCARGHPWTAENVVVNGYKNGEPMHCCLICKRDRGSRYREARRQAIRGSSWC